MPLRDQLAQDSGTLNPIGGPTVRRFQIIPAQDRGTDEALLETPVIMRITNVHKHNNVIHRKVINRFNDKWVSIQIPDYTDCQILTPPSLCPRYIQKT